MVNTCFRIYGLIGILFIRFAEFVISGYEYGLYRFERFFVSEKHLLFRFNPAI